MAEEFRSGLSTYAPWQHSCLPVLWLFNSAGNQNAWSGCMTVLDRSLVLSWTVSCFHAGTKSSPGTAVTLDQFQKGYYFFKVLQTTQCPLKSHCTSGSLLRWWKWGRENTPVIEAFRPIALLRLCSGSLRTHSNSFSTKVKMQDPVSAHTQPPKSACTCVHRNTERGRSLF